LKLFTCTCCSHPVYFENTICLHCKASLGFDPTLLKIISLQNKAEGIFEKFDGDQTSIGELYKYCLNKQHSVCNWLIPAMEEESFCVACQLNQTIPNLNRPDQLEKWQRIEVAKHRLVYALLRFKLPIIPKPKDELRGLAFDFKAQDPTPLAKRLLTGHKQGLITLNIEEADDVSRMMAQQQMDEVYRTLLGHFRHESGHYYWDLLVNNSSFHVGFQELFGNENINYAQALKSHYENGPNPNWQSNYISSYASSHPWEDWAETWAHYLHMVGALETGFAFGLTLHPRILAASGGEQTLIDMDPYRTNSFEEIMERWIPLSFMMNSLNRSLGLKDSYPFVINEAVKSKMAFIHSLIKQSAIED
jgi:hypothetical protein